MCLPIDLIFAELMFIKYLRKGFLHHLEGAVTNPYTDQCDDDAEDKIFGEEHCEEKLQYDSDVRNNIHGFIKTLLLPDILALIIALVVPHHMTDTQNDSDGKKTIIGFQFIHKTGRCSWLDGLIGNGWLNRVY